MDSTEYSITITKRAEDNLDEICSYISLNSSHEQAEIFLGEIINKIENLKILPKKWRKVPELNDPNFREFIFRRKYRVIYQIFENTNTIEIITIFSSRMLLRL